MYKPYKPYKPKHKGKTKMNLPTVIVLIEMIAILILMVLTYFDVSKHHENIKAETEMPKSVEPIIEVTQPTEPAYEPFDSSFYININNDDAELLAKVAWGEFNDARNKEQISAVMWCVLNRLDAEYDGQKTVSEVVKAAGQFNGYSKYAPIVPEYFEIAKDVLFRHGMEKHYGVAENVSGRTLPSEYLFFSGNGNVNIFRTEYAGGSVWDFSWGNPYREE